VKSPRGAAPRRALYNNGFPPAKQESRGVTATESNEVGFRPSCDVWSCWPWRTAGP